MKRILLSLLTCGMFIRVFAQTPLQPDQYESNNTINQARYLFNQTNFDPSDAPPGNKRVYQANFHDVTDTSDWYRTVFYNPSLFSFLPVYWGSPEYNSHTGCYHYMETVEVAISGMVSDAVYSLSINNATSSTTASPALPLSVSGSHEVRIIVQFKTNNCGSGETLLIGVRRMGEITINEGYTLTLSFNRNMPGPPAITAISPTSGPVGTTVTITGNNLGAGPFKYNKIDVPADPYPYCYSGFPITSTPLTSITTTVPYCAITGPITATTSFGGGMTTSSQIFTVTNDSTASSKNDGLKWEIIKGSVKSSTGKLFVTLPKSSEWDMTIYVASTNKVLSNTMLKTNFVLQPGVYDLEINHIRIKGVPVEKGNNTRLKVGILHITTPDSWTLYDEGKQKVLINSMGAQTRGLPIGKYKLTIMGQEQNIEIKDGETAEY